MTIRVCVAGATGWVGGPLCHSIASTNDLLLVGAVSRTCAERSLKSVFPEIDLDLQVRGSVDQALAVPVDVMVDYTKADVVKANVMTAIGRGVHVVIGSSGLSDEDFAEINEAAVASKVGVVAAGNFAITAVLLQRFACEAAKYISQWEIIDYASDKKQDAPSGTARELAFRLSEVRQPEVTHPIEQTIGEKASRGFTLKGSQIHSLRLPGHVLSIEAVFGAKDERLTIRHDAGSGAEPYIQGTLLAIRKVREFVGVVRGLDRLL
jgi:4-hydroxy-tetrahydrodipicolinate reductase